MKTNALTGATALCLLVGCSSQVGPDPEGVAGSTEDAPPVAQPVNEPSDEDELIVGSVSAIIPTTDTGSCTALGMPVTLFLTDAFGPNALVDETATQIYPARCRHIQTLQAPASAWAKLAYVTICQGADDSNVCGAQATRECSVDILRRWAETTTEPVLVSDPIFGFYYSLSPLGDRARIALLRRAVAETDTLVSESLAILMHLSGGPKVRPCPDESFEDVQAGLLAAFDLRQTLTDELSGFTRQ